MAKTKYTAGPHTPPLAHVDVHSVTIQFHAKKSQSHRQMLKRGGAGVRGGVKREHCLVREQDSGTFAGWGFAKNLEELEKSQWPLLMAFLPTL